jgi:hypothetical protein
LNNLVIERLVSFCWQWLNVEDFLAEGFGLKLTLWDLHFSDTGWRREVGAGYWPSSAPASRCQAICSRCASIHGIGRGKEINEGVKLE